MALHLLTHRAFSLRTYRSADIAALATALLLLGLPPAVSQLPAIVSLAIAALLAALNLYPSARQRDLRHELRHRHRGPDDPAAACQLGGDDPHDEGMSRTM